MPDDTPEKWADPYPLRLTEQQRARAGRVAAELDLSLAEALRRAVADWLNRHDTAHAEEKP